MPLKVKKKEKKGPLVVRNVAHTWVLFFMRPPLLDKVDVLGIELENKNI